MNQYSAIKEIRQKLRQVILQYPDTDVERDLIEVDKELDYFFQQGIDFKEVVDTLDDGILITDKAGRVLYVNPAYSRNTGINANEILGKNIYDLSDKEDYFSGGAIPDVLETGKSAFRLSTLNRKKTDSGKTETA